MPRLKVLSGKDLLRILGGFGFLQFSQKGSHIKVRRTLPGGSHQTLTLVNHDEIDRGTLYAIYRQALRFISEAELRPHFFYD